jgi:phosphate starvation-inducible PhoH-like protein
MHSKGFNKLARKGEGVSLPTPKTQNQKRLINSIVNHPLTVTLGPAGTGKSYCTAVIAAHLLKEKRVEKIVITRPTVPTGRSLGFFPGTPQEKLDPWVKPIMEVLVDALGKGDVECLIKNERIEVVPFETIRGRSFRNSFVILDEAQNCTYEEIKAFLTRLGEDSKTVINGDISQSDLEHASGLEALLVMIENSEALSKSVPLIEFTSDDVVRSGLCKLLVQEFEMFEYNSSRDHPQPNNDIGFKP